MGQEALPLPSRRRDGGVAVDLGGPPAVTVEPTAGVKEAAELLATRGFTVLPAVDGGGEMMAIVSEWNLAQDRFPPRREGAVPGPACPRPPVRRSPA
ncbi:MAG: hypothetical protein QOK26_759 [Pseudonocardiales bacterium]|nr:hypothetical protein [Pseudonocardiales bacterium]